MRKILAALVIIATVASCAKPKDLEFVDVQNIRLIKMGLTESLIGVDVRFFNPNNQRVKLKDAAAKVYVNSSFLGDTNMDSVVSVPRRDTFAVPLVLKVQTATAIAKMAETAKDSAVTVRVEGTVKMGKAGVFVTYPIKYERLQSLADLNF
ncbi:MAG: LEA type 2 family protein [Chitinophagaceae bacterium]|nr:LEA type 2 family protein [Chitinophagaceae bacterium]